MAMIYSLLLCLLLNLIDIDGVTHALLAGNVLITRI